MRKRARRLTVACALIASAALMLVIAAGATADTVQVDTTVDEDDSNPLDCSLREATYTVNGGADVGGCTLQTAAGADTITFDPVIFPAGAPVETIDLTAFGQLQIDTADDNAVELQGPGSDELIVTNTNPTNRIFNLPDLADTVAISGLEISGGELIDPGTQQGAGILTSAALSLDDVEVRNNTAAPFATPSGTVSAQGAGIWSENALTIRNSVIADNTATAANADDDVTDVFANGGGIWHDVGGTTLTIENSIVSGNDVLTEDLSTAGAGFNEAVGGGIFSIDAVTITQTTLSGNSAEANSAAGSAQAKGGGIRLGGLDSRIELSTIVGNTVVAAGTGPPERGAGVMVIDTLGMPLVSSTIANNGDATVDTEGANLFAEGGSGGAAVTNTIIASPVGGAGTSNCFEDTAGNIVSDGFNLDYEPGALTSSCNVVEPPTGTDVFGEDPMLGALADNGGFGETRRPLPGSPVIDQGNDDAQDITDEDQRGLDRPAFFADISNAPLGDGADIGAVEVQIAPPTFTTTTPASPNADDTPFVLGSVPVLDVQTFPSVQLFTNASCTVPSGNPASPNTFESPGIEASPAVPHNNVVTTFHGTVETDHGVSHCSTGLFPNTIDYQNTLIDPTPPVVSPPPVTTTPAPKKKCKKGFVRKKGKCVRKKRKRKG
jgi:CSLREA domain-containing protein